MWCQCSCPGKDRVHSGQDRPWAEATCHRGRQAALPGSDTQLSFFPSAPRRVSLMWLFPLKDFVLFTLQMGVQYAAFALEARESGGISQHFSWTPGAVCTMSKSRALD